LCFYFTLLPLPLLAAAMLWFGKAHDLETWGILTAMGLFGGIAQLLMTGALKWGPRIPGPADGLFQPALVDSIGLVHLAELARILDVGRCGDHRGQQPLYPVARACETTALLSTGRFSVN
jgi:hypothetical protein